MALKAKKVGWETHPNICEAISLLKAEQAATEISLTQPAEEGLPIGRSRKYREHGKRLVTMKEKYKVGDCTLKLSAVGCH